MWKLCSTQDGMYGSPHLNDILYLHYQGITKIEHLEEYTNVKCLYLQNNLIKKIENLNGMKCLKLLFLNNNAIEKIENLEDLLELDKIDLSNNLINNVENLSGLKSLTSLDLSHNKLQGESDIAHLTKCGSLTLLRLSHNHLSGPSIIELYERLKQQNPDFFPDMTEIEDGNHSETEDIIEQDSSSQDLKLPWHDSSTQKIKHSNRPCLVQELNECESYGNETFEIKVPENSNSSSTSSGFNLAIQEINDIKLNDNTAKSNEGLEHEVYYEQISSEQDIVKSKIKNLQESTTEKTEVLPSISTVIVIWGLTGGGVICLGLPPWVEMAGHFSSFSNSCLVSINLGRRKSTSTLSTAKLSAKPATPISKMRILNFTIGGTINSKSVESHSAGHTLYAAMYLNTPNDVTRAARPSFTTKGTHEMLASFDVKGEATDDSASEREIPTWAAFRAPQSLAPSPHIAVEKKTWGLEFSLQYRKHTPHVQTILCQCACLTGVSTPAQSTGKHTLIDDACTTQQNSITLHGTAVRWNHNHIPRNQLCSINVLRLTVTSQHFRTVHRVHCAVQIVLALN
ncbi:hypothetical protein B566_EDAN004443 [Ephemera danica]|nr:hypothetical protein B566_EDAN004443 [Ephemera danica]